ncbi:hypothetical protein [Cellvibrio sp. UBA7671]
MLRFVTLLSRTKDEANQLIPECAVGVDTESSVWITRYRPHYFID